MTALDAPTQQQHAVPAPTVGPAPAGHRHSHRPARTGDRHPHYRWLLIPADQRVPDTWWPAHTPRRRDTDTAHLPPVPAHRAEVLAEMRADLEVTP